MLRRLPVVLASLAAVVGCQEYRFKQVSAQPVQVVNQTVTVGAKQKPPDIMIVQDTSGSMNEPIQLSAPNGVSCLAATGAGNCNQETGYYSGCALGCGPCTDPTDCATKLQLVTGTMTTILNGLKPTSGELNMGIAAFGGADQTGCNTGSIQVPIGDAVTTIPQINEFYANSGAGGGTPTAATLAVAATDPAMTNPDPTARKFMILVTDGLPNCAQTSPCTTTAWSNGQSYSCASPNEVDAMENVTATPPSTCTCSFGNCPDGGSANFCCPPDEAIGTPNAAWYCLDDQNTESEIASLYSKQNITTYVVGMGYDYASNPTILNAMAAAGHGNSTAFQASTPAALTSALTSLIQSVVATCNYTLDATPVNPGLITVTLNNVALVAGDPNGYTYTPPTNLSINGTACTALTSMGSTPESLQITAIAN